ncbi:hypothetical protein [Saccharospirillum sp.]|uniref:hypothetical protein n=1 Tax=Saccharospirillum sp. TaxID=2033801 RepID=UPI00329688D3
MDSHHSGQQEKSDQCFSKFRSILREVGSRLAKWKNQAEVGIFSQSKAAGYPVKRIFVG